MNGTGTHGAGLSAALGAPMARGIPVVGERGHVMTFTPAGIASAADPAPRRSVTGQWLGWHLHPPDHESVPTSQKMIAEQASVYLGRSAAGQCSHGKRPWHPAAVVCHGLGTTLRGFLPRGWDHPVASNGTISLATSPAGSPRWPNTFACPRSATKALAVTSTSMNSGAPSGTGVPRYLGAILQALTMRTHSRAYAYANRTHGHRHECVLQP